MQTWLVAMIGLCLLAIGLLSHLIGQFKSRRHVSHPIQMRWFIGSGFMFLLVACLSYKEIYREDAAILMTKSEIRQAATDDSPVVRILYPGKDRITDTIGDGTSRAINLDGGD